METLVIDNFGGSMTQYINGDINSGLSNETEVVGQDQFQKPGRLTWNEQPVQIDAAGSVITDLIMDGKSRVEGGITYVYAIGHTGRLYKIQVNDPTTKEPNYDNPVLLATLTAQSPTFTRGGFIDFYGSTERIYIGSDVGVTQIDFAGTNETFVGVKATWKQNVPRPLKQFVGKLYVGNGPNVAEIDSTLLVTTYTKIDPGFPDNTQVRDLDLTPDGNYLDMVVSSLPLGDITSKVANTPTISSTTSYIFKWNGDDKAATSVTTFPNLTLSANKLFGDEQYTFGYDVRGGGVYNPVNKIITSNINSSYAESPMPNAIVSYDNLVSWWSPLYYDGVLQGLYSTFGSLSREVGPGYWAPTEQFATGTEEDVNRVPYAGLVSNYAIGTSFNNYTGNIFGAPKIYFSTLESSETTVGYKFYYWNVAPTGGGTPIEGIYQTQTQLFSKKIKVKEVRIYGEPWVANNDFTIDLIGSDGDPITNGSYTFTEGSTITAGEDFAKYNPAMAPTYAIAVRITNGGTANHTINKIEIDYESGGE